MRCPQRRGTGMLPQSQLLACWPPVSLQSGPAPDGSEKRDRAADRSTWRQEIVGSTGSSADLMDLLVGWSARKPSEHVNRGVYGLHRFRSRSINVGRFIPEPPRPVPKVKSSDRRRQSDRFSITGLTTLSEV